MYINILIKRTIYMPTMYDIYAYPYIELRYA